MSDKNDKPLEAPTELPKKLPDLTAEPANSDLNPELLRRLISANPTIDPCRDCPEGMEW
jgi:hypothetical protein